jgi:hypothetical protein
MKFRTSKKDITNKYSGYYYQVCIGYCDMQYLLNYENPIAYTCGTYGWNADIYDVSDIVGYNVCIVTGYRPFGNIRLDYDKKHEYEKRAEQIVHDYKRDFEERKKELQTMIADLIKPEIIKQREKQGL